MGLGRRVAAATCGGSAATGTPMSTATWSVPRTSSNCSSTTSSRDADPRSPEAVTVGLRAGPAAPRGSSRSTGTWSRPDRFAHVHVDRPTTEPRMTIAPGTTFVELRAIAVRYARPQPTTREIDERCPDEGVPQGGARGRGLPGRRRVGTPRPGRRGRLGRPLRADQGPAPRARRRARPARARGRGRPQPHQRPKLDHYETHLFLSATRCASTPRPASSTRPRSTRSSATAG